MMKKVKVFNLNYSEKYRNFIMLINRELEDILNVVDDEQAYVRQAMKYSVEAGGKRIRPVLTLAFCEALGGDVNKALPFAAAIELIHSYSLIHDDLPCMDNDDIRRGKPSCHIKFGEANALLAGDALLTLSFNIASTRGENISDNQRCQAMRILSDMSGINGMIGGQVIDLKYEDKTPDLDIIKNIHMLKTSALISAAAQLGCIAAERYDLIKQAGEYGQYLGLAFQIIDDILDIYGNSEKMGKPVGSDDEQNKTTYCTYAGIEKSKKDAAEYTDLARNIIKSLGSDEFLMTLTDSLLSRQY